MRIRSMIAAIASFALAGLVLAAPAAQAHQVPGQPYSFDLAAGQGCAFAVTWSGHDATVLTPKPNGAVHSAGYYDVTITNPANGKSVFRVASGPGDFSPNGRVIYARGAWVAGVPADATHPNPRILFLDGGTFRIWRETGAVFKRSATVTTQDLCHKVA